MNKQRQRELLEYEYARLNRDIKRPCFRNPRDAADERPEYAPRDDNEKLQALAYRQILDADNGNQLTTILEDQGATLAAVFDLSEAGAQKLWKRHTRGDLKPTPIVMIPFEFAIYLWKREIIERDQKTYNEASRGKIHAGGGAKGGKSTKANSASRADTIRQVYAGIRANDPGTGRMWWLDATFYHFNNYYDSPNHKEGNRAPNGRLRKPRRGFGFSTIKTATSSM